MFKIHNKTNDFVCLDNIKLYVYNIIISDLFQLILSKEKL